MERSAQARRLEARSGRPAALVAAALMLALAAAAPAALACDSTSCALLTRDLTGLLPKGALRIDLSFRRTDDGLRLEGSVPVDEVVTPKVALEHRFLWPAYHREVDGGERFLQVDAAYGLTSRASLLASVPMMTRRSYTVAHFGRQQEYGTDGIGDALLGVRYAPGPPGLVAGLSLKLPTARYEVPGDYDGSILDPAIQPGSGAVDVVASLQCSGRLGTLGLGWSAAASYQMKTANKYDYRFGDDVIASVGVNRRLAGRLSASFQAKLFHQDRNRWLGETVPSTGATFVYLSPGLRWDAPGRVSLYGFVQVPGYRYVNEAQLAPRSAFLAGVSKTF